MTNQQDDGATANAKAFVALVEQPFGHPVGIETKSGVCMIYNTHLVHPKVMEILTVILNHSFWEDVGPGVMSIVFRGDGHPKKDAETDCFAKAHPDTNSAAINLMRTWEASLEIVLEEKGALSLRTALWHELLTSLLHEIHHVSVFAALGRDEVFSEEDYTHEEEAAKTWAKEMIIELVKNDIVDTEPPAMAEEPFFGLLFFTQNLMMSARKDPGWDFQLELLEKNVAWADPKDGMCFKTYNEWILIESGDDAVSQIEASQLELINKDTGAVSNPQTAAQTAVVASGPVITHIETTRAGGGTTEKGAEAVAIARNIHPVGLPGEVDDAAPTTTEATEGPLAIAFGQVPELPEGYDADPEALELMGLDENGEVERMTTGPVPPINPQPMSKVAVGSTTDMFTGPGTVAESTPEPATVPPAEANLDFDPVKAKATIHSIIQALSAHIFNKCGFVAGAFANPAAVLEPVSLNHIAGAAKMVVACDTADPHGNMVKGAKVLQSGIVKGLVFSKTKLPAYHLYLQLSPGHVVQRRIVPQNIQRQTKTAMESRNGNHIAWWIDALEQQKNAAFKLKYTNGVINDC